MKKQIISTKNAPSAVGPYVQGIKAGNTVYVSGQLGIDVALGKLPDTLEAQAHASMKNLGAILKEAGASYGDIVKTTIFLQDMNDFGKVNEIYKSYLRMDSQPAPAWKSGSYRWVVSSKWNVLPSSMTE